MFALVATGARPELAGVYGDDAIYLSEGASLAEGLGPVVRELPGAPPLAKYPPLYPWLLAGLDRIGVDLGSPAGVLVVMGISAAAWAWAVDRLVNGVMPARAGTPTERALVALACGANTLVVGTVPTAMTEGLYTLVLVGQLTARGGGAVVLAAIGGGLRSAGLVLNLALAPGARDRVFAVLAGTGMAVLLTAWARHGVPPSADYLYYYADYRTHTAWYVEAMTAGPGAVVDVLSQVVGANLAIGAGSLGELIFPQRTVGIAGDAVPFGVGALVLALYGLARRAPALVLPLLANTALFLVWTWPFAPRFWLPVFPLVVLGVVWGLAAIPRVGRLLVVPVMLLFTAGNAVGPAWGIVGRLSTTPSTDPAELRLHRLEEWLADGLGPEDILVGGPESLWLARRHGFQAIPLKSLLPRDALLASSLGLATGAGDASRGLEALRADRPGVRIWVVLPAGSPPPTAGVRAILTAPEGYAAWEVPG